jgi:hypothetical protein
MATTPITELITALNRREDTQAIPNFSGNATEQYISSWLSEAEAVATIHNWDDATKRNNFASRLKGPALKWHSERVRSNPNDTYTQWKTAIKDHFKHPADRDKQLQKLENLTQKPNQSVRVFIEKINNTYNSIYDDTQNQNLSIKNDLLVKILLKGVLKPIKTLMVLNQMLPEVTTWDDAQKAAIRCETTLYKTQASGGTLELPNLTTPNVDSLAAAAIQQQQKQIEALQKQLNKINFLGDENNHIEDSISYIGTPQRGRSPHRSYGNNPHAHSVKWSDKHNGSQNHQYDRSRSRDQYKQSHHNQSHSGESYHYKSNQNRQQSYPNRNRQEQKSNNTPDPSPRPQDKGSDLKKIQCFRCDGFGHTASECRTKNPRKFRRHEK